MKPAPPLHGAPTIERTRAMERSKPTPQELQAAAGKTIALFAVPGAFTPTCSRDHLPGFIEKAEAIKAKGVDTIACMAVNDAFVMGAWGKQAGADGKVLMLADGNGDYTRALDLVLDGTGFGLGMRGKRFALIVDNGKVTQAFIEEAGQFKVSSADNVLAHL